VVNASGGVRCAWNADGRRLPNELLN
jgi:hypothetical protein